MSLTIILAAITKSNSTNFRVEDFNQSLHYLILAIDCNKKIRDDELNLSSTHLNVCAMYSKKGDHELAY